MISTLRSQVGFAAAVAHALLRLSRLELIGGSGRTAGRYVRVSRLLRAPSFRRPPSSRRGEVLWEREAANWRRPGRVRWGLPLLSRPRGAFCSGDACVSRHPRCLFTSTGYMYGIGSIYRYGLLVPWVGVSQACSRSSSSLRVHHGLGLRQACARSSRRSESYERSPQACQPRGSTCLGRC